MCGATGIIGIESDFRRHFLMSVGVYRHAKGARGFQRIDDVKIMRETLGKILPGMHGGVGAYESFLPVGARPLLVVAL